MLVFTRARLGALSLKNITASVKDAASYALYGTNNRLLAELTSRVLQVRILAMALIEPYGANEIISEPSQGLSPCAR